MVIALDANDDVRKDPIISIMRTGNLENVFLNDLPEDQLPASHIRGSRPITSIFASAELEVVQSGVLAQGVGVQADHRNMYVDFHENQFLGAPMFLVQKPDRRRLQLFDLRIVKKFNTQLKKHIVENNIHEKVQNAFKNVNLPLSKEYLKEINSLDNQVGRAISSAERKCRKFRDGQIPYSPVFIKHVRHKQLWHALIRKYKNNPDVQNLPPFFDLFHRA